MAQRQKSDDAAAFQKALGRELQTIRKVREETQVDVAAAIDRHRSFISELESGHHNPSIDMLRLLCNFYDVKVGSLIQSAEDNISLNSPHIPYTYTINLLNVPTDDA